MPRDVAAEKESVKVIVRVRPLTPNEQNQDIHKSIAVTAHSKTATICMRRPEIPSLENEDGRNHNFQFDHVFWSLDGPDADGCPPSSQGDVFSSIGRPLVHHAFHGFNSCLFAYGQTGSGKTYTMMGANVNAIAGADAGVTPRICLEIFRTKAGVEEQGHTSWTVDLGYVEVYNERVSDLLAKRKKGGKPGEAGFLEVREHPSRGVFIEGQRFVEVRSVEDVMKLVEVGNAVRHTAATKMNDHSSRSHAIVMLVLREERTMTTKTGEAIRTAGKSSRMNLVDLAGSERVSQSHVVGQQFKEATHINLSLTTLGRVIDVLADMTKRAEKSQWTIPPYRESKVTYILKDSLGGNSKTFMIATVSPSALNYEETLSTLRYASRARDIVNVAHVNEDPRARRIRELEEQMDHMRQAMHGGDPAYVRNLEEKLALLESEAQKRAADLQALEKEREKNEMHERLLRSTEEERQELLSKADELAKEVEASRRQAEEVQRLNQRLKAEQEERERTLAQELLSREAAVASVWRRKDEEIESGRAKLEKAMADLDRERSHRDETMRMLHEQQGQLRAALRDTQRTEAERRLLEQQTMELTQHLQVLEDEAAEGSRLLKDLGRVQQDCAEMERISHLLQLALHEADTRYHAVLTFLLSTQQLCSDWEEQCRWRQIEETERALGEQISAAATEKMRAHLQNIEHADEIEKLQKHIQTLEQRLSNLTLQTQSIEEAHHLSEDRTHKLKDKVGVLEGERATLQAELRAATEASESAYTELEKKLGAAEAERDELKGEVGVLEGERATLQAELRAATEASESAYTELEKKLGAAEAERDELKGELGVLEGERATLQAELRAATGASESVYTELEKKLGAAEAERDELKGEVVVFKDNFGRLLVAFETSQKSLVEAQIRLNARREYRVKK